MKRNLLATSILAAGFLTGCTVQLESELHITDSVTIHAGISNPETRVALGESIDGRTKVLWTRGDSFALTVGESETSYVFTTDLTEDSEVADFTCRDEALPVLSPGSIVVATYPVFIPDDYTNQSGMLEDLSNYMVMNARSTAVSNDYSDLSLLFEHQTSVVKMTLANDAFVNSYVTDITLSSEEWSLNATSSFKGDDDGTIVVYFVVSLEKELNDAKISAVCGESVYSASLGAKTLVAGKLYKVSKSLVDTGEKVEVQNLSPVKEGKTDEYCTANSYIVSKSGQYKFVPTKGNSSESVGEIASMEVLWESFGTEEEPCVGDLVHGARYSDGYISFKASGREGNAVLAAKDNNGKILWSWHIWLTDQPLEQIYKNDAGTMMDRNLGATSATSGDVKSLGLLYQWGRKDPFLGSSSISQSVRAKSTLQWPQPITSGNIQLAIENPTTFIKQSSGDEDWYVTSPRDDERWMVSKTIYDPCPYGWHVPEGSVDGIWDLAGFDDLPFDTQNKGIFFEIESPATTWYPATGAISNQSGSLYNTAYMAMYWSATPTVNKYANVLSLIMDGTVIPWYYDVRATGNPVRCCKEELKQQEPEAPSEPEYGKYVDMSQATDLSRESAANSYIISKSGTYKLKTVKGNSQELVGASSNVDPVGEIHEAEILWESFGTSQEVKKRDLITAVYYEDSYVAFKTADEFQEGNAVIAVRDKDGGVLWSWHIWMTDEPKGQVYYNDAGIFMDRNLGATSAKPGDVEAQGLLYQWGRKDPFLGSSAIDEFEEAASSTIEWPAPVDMDSNSGTLAYVTANPTTYISGKSEWMASPDENRWSETKTIYDPCPAGWHVPLGGMYGPIAKAVGSPSNFEYTYDETNMGINFSGKFGADDIIWYPAFNGRSYAYGDFALKYYSNRYYWFCNSYSSDQAFCMSLSSKGNVYPYNFQGSANALPVRCCKE